MKKLKYIFLLILQMILKNIIQLVAIIIIFVQKQHQIKEQIYLYLMEEIIL